MGVQLTNLDDPLFDGSGATKRDLVTYLDSVADRILPELADRPLSVIRVHRGQEAFMQKNLPSYTPAWVQRVTMWAESSKREVSYALCNDRQTLLWFANQRAVEYHPSLIRLDNPEHMTHLVLDIDPPQGMRFPSGARSPGSAAGPRRRRPGCRHQDERGQGSAHLCSHRYQRVHRRSRGGDLRDRCTSRAIGSRRRSPPPSSKTTVPARYSSIRLGSAAQRSSAAYSPRVRPGAPVSFPLDWDELDDVSPADFTLLTAVRTSAMPTIGQRGCRSHSGWARS